MNHNNKYIIHSKSERGFWSKKCGWVYRATTATKFSYNYVKNMLRFPVSSKQDAEWMVYEYGE